jgi:ankyrin repeat protein
MKKLNMRSYILPVLALMVFCSVYADAQSNDWLRSRGTIPYGAVAGGHEDNDRQTYICRVSYRGGYIGGKALDDRCYYNAGNSETSTSRFDVLVGTGYSWSSSKSSSRAVVVGGNDEENYYVCRVSVSRGVYPGRTEDGRCYYTRNNRGYSSRSYETLQGNRRSADLLSAASSGNYRDVRDALDDGQAINQRDSNGRTALMLAAERGHDDVIRELLSGRPDINARDEKGNTALMFAADKGDVRIFESLFRSGADPRIKNDDGESAFVKAASGGNTSIVRMFLEDSRYGGADEYEQATAMNSAAYYGRTEMLSLFVDRGMSPDTIGANGTTPLMRASEGGRVDTIRYLLGMDVNINATDNSGLTPFHYAVLSNSDKALRVYVEEREFISRENTQAEEGMRLAALKDKRKSLEYLLDTGVDVNSVNGEFGVTALMLAAGEGNEKATEMLVRFKADLNKQSLNGRTALMEAAGNSKNNTTKVLIKAGADLNIRDNNGTTALGWAIRNDHKDTRKELQKAGAKQ